MTLDHLSDFLDFPASKLLAAPPFADWQYKASIEHDLDELIRDYVFLEMAVDVAADENDLVTTIWVHFDDSRPIWAGLSDIPLRTTRNEILDRFGVPSRSGGELQTALGPSGRWDRFSMRGYSVHFQYRLDSDSIQKVTLMRADVVPH